MDDIRFAQQREEKARGYDVAVSRLKDTEVYFRQYKDFPNLPMELMDPWAADMYDKVTRTLKELGELE